jgi:phenylpyruvate C(3)-methyltransferase
MSAEITSNSHPPAAEPNDLLAEGARARKLSSDVEGVKSLVEGIRLINDTVLTQVLFALWDSGFYEYSLTHPRFHIQAAADELQLDATTLRWLLEYLVGRGILQTENDRMGLTAHGVRLSNILLRGTMNLYVGGWGPQLANIGPLLRKEMTREHYRTLRSGRHTVMGTEQLICVRTVPAILKILARKKLSGILHLACRTGQFLIELARSEPSLHGIGVDRASERIATARANALDHGVESRMTFVTAEVGGGRLPIDEASLNRIDVVAALYLLHEVARHGRQKVVDLLREMKEMFPGRLFLFMETLPGDNQPPGKKPPATFTQLDYLLIHRLRGQGLPLPAAEWKSILEQAGLQLLEMQEVYTSGVYLAGL